ncbi:hypothetical protein MUN88_02320 [Gracilibacillus caseinilyticus]|uniref:Uncharacterized protein n=1 Tax=Gracilibacillus caseinilyticus TaxID=2932256 RepID=A0ABY4EXI3_9BACI|nr:hypothetical protein [Gracilibacillus caseinilyticus]UOQ48994.1 hypothetical protein MUN88_02320 [Gracilibacillus caseinilyticus]
MNFKFILFAFLFVLFGYSASATSWTASYLAFEDNWRDFLVVTPQYKKAENGLIAVMDVEQLLV